MVNALEIGLKPRFSQTSMNQASGLSRGTCPGAEIGRQAWLRAMCPLGRAGSTPALGT